MKLYTPLSKWLIAISFIAVLIVVLSVGLFKISTLAQSPPEVEWDKTFDLSGEGDGSYSVQQTSDGGYIIAGHEEWGVDLWLIKTDSGGNEQWINPFYGSGVGYSVQQTSDGGYIITGTTPFTTPPEYPNGFLMKTDSTGNEQWYKIFGGSYEAMGYSVQQTSDGGYIIAGYIVPSGAGSNDIWLIKTDSAGNEEWNNTFNGLGWDEGYSVQQTSDGGYVLTGYTYQSTSYLGKVWLIKTDSGGNEQWTKTFGDSGDDQGHSVQQTSDGGYVITGWSSVGVSDLDVLMIKTDSAGNEQWTKTFNYSPEDMGYSVQQTLDGGYVITGQIEFQGDSDVLLIKTDSAGNEQWTKTLGDLGYDSGNSVQQTSDGGYIIAGHIWSFETDSHDVWLIKIATEATGPASEGGCFIATAAYGTPMAEEVDILRDFRDQYLLTNPTGEALVELYYKTSPPVADFIAEHPALKQVVRAGLEPIIAMSTVTVNTTIAQKIAILSSMVLVSAVPVTWLRRRTGRSSLS